MMNSFVTSAFFAMLLTSASAMSYGDIEGAYGDILGAYGEVLGAYGEILGAYGGDDETSIDVPTPIGTPVPTPSPIPNIPVGNPDDFGDDVEDDDDEVKVPISNPVPNPVPITDTTNPPAPNVPSTPVDDSNPIPDGSINRDRAIDPENVEENSALTLSGSGLFFALATVAVGGALIM